MFDSLLRRTTPLLSQEARTAQAHFVETCRGALTVDDYAASLEIDPRYIRLAESQDIDLSPEQLAYIAHKAGLRTDGASHDGEADTPPVSVASIGPRIFPPFEQLGPVEPPAEERASQHPSIPEHAEKHAIVLVARDPRAAYSAMSLEQLLDEAGRNDPAWFHLDRNRAYYKKANSWTAFWSIADAHGACTAKDPRDAVIDALEHMRLAMDRKTSTITIAPAETTSAA